ncbi:dipeptide ABC transporter ATP-binding protein [Desulfonema ishimotonii]|uniref:Dipeptide ABC transporter ATP-binding protein n=1 Tax=Desulfonema ishimotonii TaxID=45657 RepID=A0A401G0A5_9BACT|nr:ABC transporter ATP-binding protein [Desulfonema ishimotonii]GBC62640.1 dipeptide ABC transporter ATP-binding protein [Desulfonema ishimotonii]
MDINPNPILQVRHLITAFDTEAGIIRAVDDVSFSVSKGETLGIVGESGCGKSVTALSVMRLLPRPMGHIDAGEILLGATDLTRLTPDRMSRIRGNRISMIFQEPMTALNPVHRIGKQISEVFRLHFPETGETEIYENALQMLRKVGIPEPEQRMREYPHQLSGGMRQRVMIAMSLACKPDILIADEPTTALDVTIQAQILDLIRALQQETGMAVIFITHDLGVIAEICDSVLVMYAGRVAETAPVRELFSDPKHPYTRGLLTSVPRLENRRKSRLRIIPGVVPSLYELPDGCRFQNRCPHAQPICGTQPPMNPVSGNHLAACHLSAQLPPVRKQHTEGAIQKPAAGKKYPAASQADYCLEADQLKMHFPVRGGILLRQIGTVYAVDGISFKIRTGETLGLVGESGCGKTTAGRSLIRLCQPTGGRVKFEGRDILGLGRRALRELRRDVQMIFQDPFESLNPRHTIGDILEEPFIIHGISTTGERRSKVAALLDRVGLPRNALPRFPHEFSGGQRQRIGIARAIALNPRVIICDEPVSALDVSIQSQIINLLLELQQEMGLTCLFISHDLTVVRHISDHIAVMYLGKIVEHTDADTIHTMPLHPYTRALLSAIPVPDPDAARNAHLLSGDVPSPIHPPAGCRFHTRCPLRIPRCAQEEPLLRSVPASADAHIVACHRAEEILSGAL